MDPFTRAALISNLNGENMRLLDRISELESECDRLRGAGKKASQQTIVDNATVAHLRRALSVYADHENWVSKFSLDSVGVPDGRRMAFDPGLDGIVDGWQIAERALRQ